MTQNYGKLLAQARKLIRKRPVLSKEYRILIYNTYNKKCAYCGKTVKWSDYEADHIIPYSKWGMTLPHNMACSCRKCNRSKSARLWTIKFPARQDKLMTMYLVYYTQGHFRLQHIL